MHEMNPRIRLLILLILIIIGGTGFFALFLNRTMVKPQTELIQDFPPISLDTEKEVNIDFTPPSDTTGTNLSLISGNSPKYEISYPTGWTQDQETDTENDTYQLLLSKNNHEITISQLEAPSAICQYPKHPAVEKTSIQFDEYEEFTNSVGTRYRRSRLTSKQPIDGFINWTVCQYQQGEDEYLSPTAYGFIVYRTPVDYNKNLLSEMDSIATSIKPLSPVEN